MAPEPAHAQATRTACGAAAHRFLEPWNAPSLAAASVNAARRVVSTWVGSARAKGRGGSGGAENGSRHPRGPRRRLASAGALSSPLRTLRLKQHAEAVPQGHAASQRGQTPGRVMKGLVVVSTLLRSRCLVRPGPLGNSAVCECWSEPEGSRSLSDRSQARASACAHLHAHRCGGLQGP